MNEIDCTECKPLYVKCTICSEQYNYLRPCNYHYSTIHRGMFKCDRCSNLVCKDCAKIFPHSFPHRLDFCSCITKHVERKLQEQINDLRRQLNDIKDLLD